MKTGKPEMKENPPFFDDEEREDIESIDPEMAVGAEEFAVIKADAETIARNTMETLRGNAAVEVPVAVMADLETIASREGTTAQSLIRSILARYLDDHRS